MEENKKSSKLQKIISCIAVGLLIFSLLQIANLNDKIDNLSNANSRLNSEITHLRNNINSIYSNVDKQLKKEASLISGVEYSIGKPKNDMKTAPLSLEVIPKLITDDMKLSVTIDGVTVPLERNGNIFAGSIDIGLFVDYGEYPLLTIKSSEGTKTEYLEDVDIANQFSNYLPDLDADMNTSSRISNGIMDINSTLSILVHNKKSEVTFTSITVIEKLNGEEISRKDITDDVLQAVDPDGYYCDYSKSFEISREYDFRVYVMAEDSLGYTHEVIAGCWMDDRMEAMAEVAIDNEVIYDKDGNLLWQKYISWN